MGVVVDTGVFILWERRGRSDESRLAELDLSRFISVANKRGSTPPEAPPVLERLGIDAAIFGVQVRKFGKLFCHVAGKPKSVSEARSLKTRCRFYQRRPAQELAVT